MPRRTAFGLLTALLVAGSFLTAAPANAADRDCGDFPSQRAAQIFFLNQGGPRFDPHGLDSDSDGIACESNPAPYYYGTSLPGGGGGGGSGPSSPPPPTHVRSTVELTLDPSKRIAGESFRMKITVRPAISRKVLVQRKVDGRWKGFATGVTGSNGRTSGVFKAPKTAATYRALVKPVTKGNKEYSAATSRARSVEVQRQQVVLTFDDSTVIDGEQVRAFVHATPVRAGRSVVLQVRSAGTWRTVRTSTLDRRGRATFTITPDLGESSFRAAALRDRGAAVAYSDTEKLAVIEVTPPPAPYDLVAVPGDGMVALTWSRSVPADFSHHEVWMRTADTSWSLVTVTDADNLVVTLLQNGVTHWFTVTSVDTHDNVSEMAEEVSATPMAPARLGRSR